MKRIWTNARTRLEGMRLRRRRERRARSIYEPTNDGAPTLAAGLAMLRRRWPEVHSPSQDRPILILAAGWRSGSTYLQRRIMAAGNVLIWGERYGHSAVIDRLAHPIRCMTASWPHEDWFLHGPVSARSLSAWWVANLYPPVETLLTSQLRFFDAAFAEPARALGMERWGIKEVRLTADHATYLRWLYPHGKLVLLYRDPYAAYRSYRRWRSWFLTWPDDAVTTPERFGRHWHDLVTGFLAHHRDVGAMLVRYEDLDTDRVPVSALSDHLEVVLPREPLQRLRSKPRASKGVEGQDGDERIPDDELASLESVVGPLAASLGYVAAP